MSYTRDDFPRLEPLLLALSEAGIGVWRDVEAMRGGQFWPQRIGEEINHHAAMLLVWSGKSSQSHFVRFEWNTALALKRTIIPILLDETKVPPSLASFQAIRLEAADATVRNILMAMAAADPVPQSSACDLIAGLGSIRAPETVAGQEKTVERALAYYRREGFITGDITAGGNVTITYHAPPSPPAIREIRNSGWNLATVATVVGILTGIATLFGILQKFFPSPKPEVPLSVLRGFVETDSQVPVSGVRVTLNEKPGDTVYTNATGGFHFDSIRGNSGDLVKVYVQHDGYFNEHQYIPLPGGGPPIILRKAPESAHVPK